MTAPLPLLIVTHSLSGGGAERFVSNLVSALDRGRFAPEVCLAVDRVTYRLPGDVPVHRLGYAGLASLPRTLLRLRRLLAARRPRVVLSNVLSTNCLVGGALTGLHSPPAWVARVGNAPGLGEPRLHRRWARAVYPRARALVANSRGMLGELQRLYPRVADRCRAIANPTDFAALDALAAAGPPVGPPVARAGAEAGGLRLLWVGRLTPQKRPDVALRAFARLLWATREAPLPGQPSLRLWMCGDGPLLARCQELAAELGIAGRVEWPGFVENPFPLMHGADLFLLTSDFEGLPNALIEAQGLGLPAVATRCPHGPDEIVEDGVTGRLVPPGDGEAVAAAALELLRDPEGRRRMGEAASRRARERFGLLPLVRQWEDLLLEAAAGVSGERL